MHNLLSTISSSTFEMDQILKARNLGSASARRRKMQEREIAMQLDEERRTKILLYGYSSEEDESSDDGDTYSPIPDILSDRSESISTVSNHTSPKISNNSPSGQSQSASYSSASISSPRPYIPELVIPQPLSPSFLTQRPDLGLPTAQVDMELDYSEPETPIEIATPILYSTPNTRPSMISIRSSTSQSIAKVPHRRASLPNSPPIPPKSDKRGSAMSVSSVSSRIDLAGTPLCSLSGKVSNSSKTAEHGVDCRRPITPSSRRESTLQYRVPNYDVFPRRSNFASPRKVVRMVACEEQPQFSPTSSPPIAINNGSTSSFSAFRKYSEPTLSASPPQLQSKRSTSTLRQRRSSIGLALRSASSPFRSKNSSSRLETSSFAESAEANEGVNVSAFPMPPPPSLLHRQSFQPQELRISIAPNRMTRMSRVRTTIGL